mgnify:CR=1 FL=1
MATLKEEALAYKPPQTLNIADLDVIPVDLEIYEKEAKNAKGERFKFKYVELNGEQYRVPNSVFEGLQTIIELKPNVTKVRVKKIGTGLNTRYKVEPID